MNVVIKGSVDHRARLIWLESQLEDNMHLTVGSSNSMRVSVKFYWKIPAYRKQQRQTRLQFGIRLLFCAVILECLSFPTCSAAGVCPENQTAELGGQGYITCSFPDGFRSVYWFDNTSDKSPVISFSVERGVKSGQGFEAGDYDINQNGSLIISNVTKWHEREYRCIVYPDHAFDVFLVSLKVIAAPGNHFPVVKCSNCHEDFYNSLMDTDTLRCSYSAARPPVQLTWFKQSGDRYEYLEMQQLNITENTNGTYHSIATIPILKESSNFIHLLTCRSTWSQSDWSMEKGILLDLSRNKSFPNYPPKTQYMEVSKHATIHCGQLDSTYVVWKRILLKSDPELIGFHTHAITKTLSNSVGIEVSSEGSLIFSSPKIHHEGLYACIYGDGQKEEIQMTSVELLIPPSPPYIQIAGCNDVSNRCVIRENSTKELTCAVYGAFPRVALEWIAEDEDQISVFNHQEVPKERDKTSDTIITVEYKVSQDVLCGEEIVIKCHLYGPLSNIMKAESIAVVIPAFCRENEVEEEHRHYAAIDVIIVAIVIWVLIVTVIVVLIICRGLYASLNSETRKPAAQIPNTPVHC